MKTTRRRRGFTLLELLLTLVIIATCLVALGASVSTGISSAADSINQRAAREICRAKLEEAIASGETSGGGQVENYPGFQYNLTSEEKTVGAADSPTEKYLVLTCTVSFPQDNPSPGASGATSGSSQAGSLTLVTMVDPPDLEKGSSGGGSSNGGGSGTKSGGK